MWKGRCTEGGVALYLLYPLVWLVYRLMFNFRRIVPWEPRQGVSFCSSSCRCHRHQRLGPLTPAVVLAPLASCKLVTYTAAQHLHQ